MTSKGTRTAIILVIIILIAVLLVVLLRSLYITPASSYGTWSDYATTFCLNEGQGCSSQGVQKKYRTCKPNPNTGYGCLDSSGNQNFGTEYTNQTCNTVCYSSIWTDTSTTGCVVFDDSAGTIIAGNQTCRNPNQFNYQKIVRECVANDPSGSNACVKADGSTLANVGDIETVLIPCTTVTDCFQGQWQPCGSNFEVKDCGGGATDCGRVIPDTVPAKCIKNIAGVPTEVSSTECYPPDDPGPCPAKCFNFPCIAYPPNYSNISSFISDNSQDVFVEIQDSTSLDKIEANYTPAQATAAANNQDVFQFSPGYVATQFANTGATIRFRIIPSQAEAANGGFYLVAALPGNGQIGTVRYSTLNMRLEVIPQVSPANLGETLDDVMPRPDLFSITGTGPYKLNLYTLPGPILIDLFCTGPPPCLNLIACNCPCGTCSGICGSC